MKPKIYFIIIFVLSLAGVLFSGYLSFKKFFTGICAFNEPCPYFLGHPACWYGFGMFGIMFVTAVVALSSERVVRGGKKIIGFVSLLGILFAGKLVIDELVAWQQTHAHFALGLPTCVYGLVFYLLIFFVTIVG